MSKKLIASHKKIDQVFDKMFEKGITPSDKDRWDEDTKNAYNSLVKNFATDYHAAYGIADITKMTDEEKIYSLLQKRMDNYHNGQFREAYNLQSIASALKAFNVGVEETRIFKKPFKIGDSDKIRKSMKEQNVFRLSKATSVLHATPEESKTVLDNIKNSGYQSQTRQIAFHVGKIAMTTGGRVSAILNLKTSDITKNDNGTYGITYRKDKGGLTRTVQIDQETGKYLESLTQGKKENQRLFSVVRTQGEKKGTFKSVDIMRREVTRIISDAGKPLERTKTIKVKDMNGKMKEHQITQKFTTHSFRKSFALERTVEYYGKFSSKEEFDKYLEQKKLENPDIDYDYKLKQLEKFVNKDRNTPRELKLIEYATFLSSIDMGHFRNDVMTSFYQTYKEIMGYIKEHFGKD